MPYDAICALCDLWGPVSEKTITLVRIQPQTEVVTQLPGRVRILAPDTLQIQAAGKELVTICYESGRAAAHLPGRRSLHPPQGRRFVKDMSRELTAAVLTASDRCSQGAPDLSGPLLAKYAAELGFRVVEQVVLPDEKLQIVKKLLYWSDELGVSLIVTTGGTGPAPRDVTPEATRMVLERPFPGICEAMRAESLQYTPAGVLSRGEAGSRGHTLIVNFPGQPKAVEQLWPLLGRVVVHACQLLSGDPHPHP